MIMSFESPYWIVGAGIFVIALLRSGALYVQLQRGRKREERETK